ncbi:hypothetical protein Nepgr_021496 [Nepenthes gracilis]|uniref:RING-type domain-containing protein n=1 Tax=Nepenthes gracilis TaxID=150966 RepID=A0AAD3SXK4_NEPGR|nr:hypothetical protein Nepgr_021496 [Nepenthes gracilis]
MMESQGFPPELKEKIEELFPGLSYEEALQHQESLYESLKISGISRQVTASDSDGSISLGPVSVPSRGESSLSGSADFDLALDEALARSLQEMEDGISHVSFSEPVQTAASNTENASAGPSVMSGNQDGVDPDQMTYEELQSLGETIGSESKGLSENDISSLPSFKYRTGGLFSKKVKTDGCVICCEPYENRQYLTTLPCAHQYHKECINRWLRQNKHCPVCKEEVDLSSS